MPLAHTRQCWTPPPCAGPAGRMYVFGTKSRQQLLRKLRLREFVLCARPQCCEIKPLRQYTCMYTYIAHGRSCALQ